MIHAREENADVRFTRKMANTYGVMPSSPTLYALNRMLFGPIAAKNPGPLYSSRRRSMNIPVTSTTGNWYSRRHTMMQTAVTSRARWSIRVHNLAIASEV